MNINDKINREKCNKLIESINYGCLLSNCKFIGGETDEMIYIYIKDKFDLVGFVIDETIYDILKYLNGYKKTVM